MSPVMKKMGRLILCILLCLGVGMIGTAFTEASAGAWYASLKHPPSSPPAEFFAPTWTLLYVMMGVSLWLAINANAPRQAYSLFYVQLLLNLFLSFMFFGLHNLFLAIIASLLLDIAIVATLFAFWNVSKASAFLLVPYLIWVLFLTILNLALFINNPYS